MLNTVAKFRGWQLRRGDAVNSKLVASHPALLDALGMNSPILYTLTHTNNVFQCCDLMSHSAYYNVCLIGFMDLFSA